MTRGRVRAIGAFAIVVAMAIGCEGGVVERDKGKSGIDAVRADRRAAIDEFATLWPALSGAATGGVTAWGRYAQCDDFGKTHGYHINGIVVSTDVTRPTDRVARTNDALQAAGWEQLRTLDKQELVRARKGDMLLVLQASVDRYLVSLNSECSPVSTKEATALVQESIDGKDALDIPGIPDIELPLPSSSPS